MRKLLIYTIIALPFAELLAAYCVGVYVGFFGVLLLLLGSTMWGMWVLRVRGVLQLRQWYQQMASGMDTTAQAMDNMLLMFAGFLLFIPGLISGFVGALLMLPWLRSQVIRAMERKGMLCRSHHHTTARSNVIEGDFWRDS